VDETVAGMGADFFCAGAHKWMFAPRGTGLVWARADRWASLRPVIPTFSDLETYVAWKQDRPPSTPNNARRMTPGGFQAYEHQWAIAAAFRMHRTLGPARGAARVRELNSRIKDGLAPRAASSSTRRGIRRCPPASSTRPKRWTAPWARSGRL